MSGKGVILLLAGAVLGAVAMLVARPAGETGSAVGLSDVAALASEIDALRSDVRALRELNERGRELPAVPAASPAATRLSDAPDSAAAEVAAWRTEFQALIGKLEAQAAESRAILGDLQAQLAAGASGAEPMPESLPDTLDLQAFDRISSGSEDEVTDGHILWTYDQVLGTYGRPTRVQPNPMDRGGGIKFLYDLPGDRTCIFWFKGGKVVRVYP